MSKAQLVLFLAGAVALLLVVLSRRKAKESARVLSISAAWPGFVDSTISGLMAGLTVHEALTHAAMDAPRALEKLMVGFLEALERRSLDQALRQLATSARNVSVDEFALLMQINARQGGAGLVELMQKHVVRSRSLNAAASAMRTKVTATLAMARLAVCAPWVLLLLLNSRAETAGAFETSAGVSILLFGLAVCVVAHRMIGVLGSPLVSRRIYEPA